MHALIQGQTVIQYPYNTADLRNDNPQTSFPSPMTDGELAEWGVLRVYPVDPPESTDTQTLVEGPPEWDGGKWVQTWTVTDLTPEQIAERLQQRRSAMSVPRLAARLALINAGLWDNIPALIDAIPDATQKAQTLAFFEDARNWKRLDPTVIALGTGLGLDDAELDALFEAAQTIDAGLL